MQRKSMLFMTLLTAGILAAGCARKKTDAEDFLRRAAESGIAEVRISELALERATHPEVREFARRMVQDHGQANDALRDLAQRKGVELPQELTDEHRSTQERLSVLSGPDFDRAYMEENVKEHEKAVDLFRRQAEDGSDADVRAFAERTLPNLEAHLQMARDLAGRVGDDSLYFGDTLGQPHTMMPGDPMMPGHPGMPGDTMAPGGQMPRHDTTTGGGVPRPTY